MEKNSFIFGFILSTIICTTCFYFGFFEPNRLRTEQYRIEQSDSERIYSELRINSDRQRKIIEGIRTSIESSESSIAKIRAIIATLRDYYTKLDNDSNSGITNTDNKEVIK